MRQKRRQMEEIHFLLLQNEIRAVQTKTANISACLRFGDTEGKKKSKYSWARKRVADERLTATRVSESFQRSLAGLMFLYKHFRKTEDEDEEEKRWSETEGEKTWRGRRMWHRRRREICTKATHKQTWRTGRGRRARLTLHLQPSVCSHTTNLLHSKNKRHTAEWVPNHIHISTFNLSSIWYEMY